MNSVSWFVYIAQVGGSLGTTFVLLGVLLMIAVMTRFAFPFFYNFVECNSPNSSDYRAPKPISRAYMALAVGFLVIGNLMPERNTMYAIAASQVGEKIANSESVRGLADDATKALQQWIQRQIEPREKARR